MRDNPSDRLAFDFDLKINTLDGYEYFAQSTGRNAHVHKLDGETAAQGNQIRWYALQFRKGGEQRA